VHKHIVDRRITLLGEVGYEAKIVDVEDYSLGVQRLNNFYCNELERMAFVVLIFGATYLPVCVWVKDWQSHLHQRTIVLDGLR